MKRVAVLFPAFLGGGAEAVCAWMLEGLKLDYAVTLVTFSDVTLQDIDDEYGTRLAGSDVEVLRLELAFPGWFKEYAVTSMSAFAVRQFALMRTFKREYSERFDVAISAFNEMDLGNAGIQYIHLPMFGRGHEKVREEVGHPDSLVRRAYREVLRLWSGYSDERMRRNLTLTNSRWTAAWVERVYGVEARVLYPPVLTDFPPVPWNSRENGFVLVARVVPEKRIEVAIEILREVRKLGQDVHLHVLSGVHEAPYLAALQRATAGEGWVHWEERLPRAEYVRLLATHKYGIHPRRNEQFGIGVAEMVVAGVIPFVPATGGQAEIVGYDSRLTYSSKEEAVTKIVDLLNRPVEQHAVRKRLSGLATQFGVEQFKEGIRGTVAEVLAGKWRGELE